MADAWPKVIRVGRIWLKINLSWPKMRSEMIGVGRRLTEVGLTLPVVRDGRIWKVLTLSPAHPSARTLIRTDGAQQNEASATVVFGHAVFDRVGGCRFLLEWPVLIGRHRQ